MESEYEDDTPQGQLIALTILGIASSLLSAIGSSLILSIILRDRKRKMKRTYHRLLLGLSLSDVSNSFRGIISGFLLPVGTPGVWYAYGTQGTCTALGFSAQLGAASALYSACLATYFYFIVQPKGNDFVTKVEPAMHVFSIGYPLATAIAGIPMDLYNAVETGIGCWVAPYPKGCLDEPEIECIRGENAVAMVQVFGTAPTILSLCIIVATMVGLYLSVRHQTKKVEARYSTVRGQNITPHALHQLRQTRSQAQFYVGAFFLTYIWVGVLRLVEGHGADANLFPIAVLADTFFPLQGFWNFFIYIRPRYIDMRRQDPSEKPRDTIIRLFQPKRRGSIGPRRRSHLSTDLSKTNWSPDPVAEPVPTPASKAEQAVTTLEEQGEIMDEDLIESTSLHDDDIHQPMRLPSTRRESVDSFQFSFNFDENVG